MKIRQFLLASTFSIGAALGQAPPPGTIVPEEITFTLGTPDVGAMRLDDLETADVRDFPGEVLLLVYFTST